MNDKLLSMLSELPGLHFALVCLQARIREIEQAVKLTPVNGFDNTAHVQTAPPAKKRLSKARLEGLARARAALAKKRKAEMKQTKAVSRKRAASA